MRVSHQRGANDEYAISRRRTGRPRRGGRAAGRLGRSGARPHSLADLVFPGLTPSAGITCGVAELGPGDWLGLHRHAPPETYYVIAGAGIVSLDGREIPVKAGSAVFIPGMAEHGIRQTGTEVLRLFYAFPIDSFDGVEYLFSGA